MATAKKSSKKTEAPKEQPKEQLKVDPAEPGEDMTLDHWIQLGVARATTLPHRPTADEYIASEYPWLETSQNIPQLLKVLVREVVKGRMG